MTPLQKYDLCWYLVDFTWILIFVTIPITSVFWIIITREWEEKWNTYFLVWLLILILTAAAAYLFTEAEKDSSGAHDSGGYFDLRDEASREGRFKW